jgi:hypothetical protein
VDDAQPLPGRLDARHLHLMVNFFSHFADKAGMEMHPATDPIHEENLLGKAPEESAAILSQPAPLQYDLVSCLARFLSSASFGIALDILILSIYGAAVLMGCRPGAMGLLYTLIEIPIIWGIMGIFFYSEMLGLARDAARKAAVIWRWYDLVR